MSKRPVRADYKVFYPISTRWSDNDTYGHINNVIYYSYFDSVANRYLIEEGGLDIADGAVVGYVVSSGCDYHAPASYPEAIEGGLRVDRLGNSSVQYGIAIFREGEDEALAHGHFVHVFVDRAANRSVPIPEGLRAALEKLTAG
ncbi:MAG TPA: thioesterase [Haliea salexigens]|jgi:acyl-CoA thioester hydrolase|uniref:Thioesterase n=1 Tax=Haliea salexigens TaxID=287487 RepID=A0A3C1KRC0_9GAMM|nr:thioesterase [Haliea sp.]HAN29260.1 thioesterase [Haliea salexigens]|tara:strand:- start:9822 stop:10253 length:432 start_codon:yes stop_codon:yes gene_type:complete